MTWLREHVLVWVGAVVVFAAAAGAAFMLWPSQSGHRAQVSGLSSTGSFEPAEAMFGDHVSARISVTGRSGLKLTPQVDFAPFQVDATTQSTVALENGRSLYRFDYTLTCLRTACKIKNGVRFFTFENSVVRSGNELTEVAWPPLPIVTRAGLSPMRTLRTGEAAAAQLRAPDTTARWIAWAAAAAALVALVALWLPKQQRRRRALPSSAAASNHLSVALKMAHVIAELVSADRLRSSLEDVACELERSGAQDAARRVRTIAWSEAGPSPADVQALVAELEGTTR